MACQTAQPHSVRKQWRIRRSDLGTVVMLKDGEPVASLPRMAGMIGRCEKQVDGLLAGLGMNKAAIKRAVQEVASRIGPP